MKPLRKKQAYFNGSNWTFTWRNGRQLATAKTGTKTTKYEYNTDGLRTRKTNADGTYSDYYWVGSTLLAEVQYGANGTFVRTLMFLHDEKGTIVGVGVKNAGDARFTHYYYAKNLQGDVVAIYRSDYTEAKGYYPTLVASYEYDPWGKVTSVKGSSGAILSLEAYPNHIAHVNPIRYRGYYYDNETGFYYLQSRYYDPVISRFINADEYASTGQGFIGTNMFAYCLNSPTFSHDTSGATAVTVAVTNYWNPVGWFFAGVIVIGAVMAAGDFIDNNISHVSSTASPPPPNNNDKDKRQNYNYDGAKSKSYVNKRGWTDDMIQRAINNGPQGTSVNMANQNSCTVYRYPGVNNQYVVIDDVTQSIVQVSDFADPGWIPDSRIIWIP